jgi:hypothetical protein
LVGLVAGLEGNMRKIRLELDALRVETFDTGAGTWDRGTVHGRNPTFDCGPYPPPEDSVYVCPVPTAAATCNQFTCAYTCGYTCSCGCTRTYEGWTCTCPEPEPGTWDINLCP